MLDNPPTAHGRDWRQPEEDFEDIMDRKEIKSTDVGNGKHRKVANENNTNKTDEIHGQCLQRRWNTTA
jgi:hypothetical protein